MSKQHAMCPESVVVSQLMQTQTRIAVEPTIEQGIPKIYCLDSCVRSIRDCDGEQAVPPFAAGKHGAIGERCAFILTQLICVEVPVEYGVNVDFEKGPVRCGRPNIGPCKTTPNQVNVLGEKGEPSESKPTRREN